MNALLLWFHKLGSPPYFYKLAGTLQPWLLGLACASGALGVYLAFFASPRDYLQGESVRILYIHAPSAWMSLFAYAFMALNGAIALIWRIKISEQLAMAAAPVGAAFTLITLVSGSLWGRPTWGTYWTWDARLTSELVLLFLYFGVIGLYRAIDDRRAAARAASLLALVGVVNLPIIHYSVNWWNTLHQGASIKLIGPSTVHESMLWPILVMVVATKLYFGWSLLARTRIAVLEQESGKEWVRALVLPPRENPQ